MRQILLVLALAFCTSQAFAQEIAIRDDGFVIFNPGTPRTLNITFTLINVPRSELNNSEAQDQARRLVISRLDVCLEQINCPQIATWRNGMGVDQTDFFSLDPALFVDFLGVSVQRQQRNQNLLDITYTLTLERTTSEAFEVGQTVALNFQVNGNNDATFTKDAIEQPDIITQISRFEATPQNKSIVLSWAAVESVTFNDDSGTTGQATGVQVYGLKLEGDDLNNYSIDFGDIATSNSDDGNAQVPNCSLTANAEAGTCSFTCDAPGYIDANKVPNTPLISQFEAGTGNSLTFENLDVDSYYAFFPQIQTNGLLEEKSDGSYTAPCAVSSPVLVLTYAELSGAETSKQQNPTCFIATAAYGHPLANELNELRWFRDEILMTTEFGRNLVDFYYEHSPSLAEKMVFSDKAKAFVRSGLWLPIKAIRWYRSEPISFLLSLMAALGLMTAVFFLGMKRRANYNA